MQWPPFKQGLGWHGSEVNARPAEIIMHFSNQGCQIVIACGCKFGPIWAYNYGAQPFYRSGSFLMLNPLVGNFQSQNFMKGKT